MRGTILPLGVILAAVLALVVRRRSVGPKTTSRREGKSQHRKSTRTGTEPVLGMMLSALLALVVGGRDASVAPVITQTTNGDFAIATVVKVGDNWFCDPSHDDGICQTTINVGDAVQWRGVGQNPHTTTECRGNLDVCPAPHLWDSNPRDSDRFVFTFDSPGTFVYRCQIHPNTMRGKIVVLAVRPPEAEPPLGDDPAPLEKPPPHVWHQPVNRSEAEEAIAIVARNDPEEQKHVEIQVNTSRVG